MLFSRYIYKLRPQINRIFPMLAGTFVGALISTQKLHQSPTFQGIPVAGTLLIHQSIPYFQRQFPKLEISGVFAPGEEYHTYTETGQTFGIYPTGCTVTLPIFEMLSIEEEERMGKALLKKQVVGVVVIEGECKAGCATASVKSIKVYKMNTSLVPEYEKPVWSWSK